MEIHVLYDTGFLQKCSLSCLARDLDIPINAQYSSGRHSIQSSKLKTRYNERQSIVLLFSLHFTLVNYKEILRSLTNKATL